MRTPLGTGALASRLRSELARMHADRALRLATQAYGDPRFANLDKHAIAADDAAFLAEDASRHGRHAEVRQHARRAREQYLLVRQMVESRRAGSW